MPDLLSEIDALVSENRDVESEVNDYIKRKHARDQSGIAWAIIIAFVVSIALIFVLVFWFTGPVEGCTAGEGVVCPQRWQDPAEFLVGVVSSILLPIVTLVLGYYFGTEQNK